MAQSAAAKEANPAAALAATVEDVPAKALAVVLAHLQGGSVSKALLRGAAADLERSRFYPLKADVPPRLRDAVRGAMGRAAYARAAAKLSCVNKEACDALSRRHGGRAAAATARLIARQQAGHMQYIVRILDDTKLLDDKAVVDALCALCAEGVTPDLSVETWPRAGEARVAAAESFAKLASRVLAKIEHDRQCDLESLAKCYANLEPGDENYEKMMAEVELYETMGPQTDLSKVGQLIIDAAPKPAAA